MLISRRRFLLAALSFAFSSWPRFVFADLEEKWLSFEDAAVLSEAKIPQDVLRIRLDRFSRHSIKVPATYARIKGGSRSFGRLRSGDGAWWEIDEENVDPAMFGAGVGEPGGDAQIIKETFNFASAKKDVSVVMNMNYLTDEDIIVPENLVVTGRGKVKIERGTWILKSKTRLSGLSFESDQERWNPVLKLDHHSCDVEVSDCSIRGGVGIWANVNKQAKIIRNKILSQQGYPLFCDGLVDGEIAQNICTTNGGYGIQLSGRLERNKIDKNVVIGDGKTLTGIIILSQHQDLVRDNAITNNTVSNVLEEGISVDYNTPTVFAQTTKSYDPLSKRLSILSSVPLSEDSVGKSLLVLDGPQKGASARVEKVLANDQILLSEATFAHLGVGDRLAIAWAPVNTRIKGNKIEHAGKTGIMLYGSQIGTVVEENSIDDCGFAASPDWQGRTPYSCAGMSLLTISQMKNESMIHACRAQNNFLSNCKIGISVGVAKWDGFAQHMPVGVQIAGNRFRNCAQSVKFENGMSSRQLVSSDADGEKEEGRKGFLDPAPS